MTDTERILLKLDTIQSANDARESVVMEKIDNQRSDINILFEKQQKSEVSLGKIDEVLSMLEVMRIEQKAECRDRHANIDSNAKSMLREYEIKAIEIQEKFSTSFKEFQNRVLMGGENQFLKFKNVILVSGVSGAAAIATIFLSAAIKKIMGGE